MAKRGADGRNDHRIACIDRLPWLVIHPGARASRPHPYSCKQPAIQGHSLAKRTEPAFTGISSIVPAFVRARRPRSRVVFVRAGRPRSRVGSFFTSRNASTARRVREIGAVHQVANEA